LGTLGTNVLQQGIDTLNTSVQGLTTAVNNLVQNIQTNGGSMGGGTATRQQGPANSNAGFPRIVNPTRLGSQTAGGNGGYGSNMSGMSSGGYMSNRSLYSGNGGFSSGALAMVGAVAGYGAQQSQQLVALNSYATQSLIGYNYNGMVKLEQHPADSFLLVLEVCKITFSSRKPFSQQQGHRIYHSQLEAEEHSQPHTVSVFQILILQRHLLLLWVLDCTRQCCLTTCRDWDTAALYCHIAPVALT